MQRRCLQVAIYDTPGMHGTKDYETRSQAMRVGATWQHVQECDLLALIVDPIAFAKQKVRKDKQGREKRRGPVRDFRAQVGPSHPCFGLKHLRE